MNEPVMSEPVKLVKRYRVDSIKRGVVIVEELHGKLKDGIFTYRRKDQSLWCYVEEVHDTPEAAIRAVNQDLSDGLREKKKEMAVINRYLVKLRTRKSVKVKQG
jgi:hypothetical protein